MCDSVTGVEYSSNLHKLILEYMPFFIRQIDPIVHQAGFGDVKLTDHQFKVIMLLNHRGPSSPGLISRMLNIQKGSLTAVLKTLRAADLIYRRQIEGNERSYLVDLTVGGREFVKHHLLECDRQFGELFAEMGDEERNVVEKGLSTLNRYLELKGADYERS
jgi:DNA-binding MarR family transcriptional regulator